MQMLALVGETTWVKDEENDVWFDFLFPRH